jgi:hypothetical protein
MDGRPRHMNGAQGPMSGAYFNDDGHGGRDESGARLRRSLDSR